MMQYLVSLSLSLLLKKYNLYHCITFKYIDIQANASCLKLKPVFFLLDRKEDLIISFLFLANSILRVIRHSFVKTIRASFVNSHEMKF